MGNAPLGTCSSSDRDMTQTTPAQAMVGELLPCPRCGHTAFITIEFGVWCERDRCLTLPPRASREEAIKAWNQRAPQSLSARAGVEGFSDYAIADACTVAGIAETEARAFLNTLPSKPGGADREETFLEGNIRIAIWNGCRARGMSQDHIILLIKDILASLKGEGL